MCEFNLRLMRGKRPLPKPPRGYSTQVYIVDRLVSMENMYVHGKTCYCSKGYNRLYYNQLINLIFLPKYG